jgi:hypothetical protein
MKKLPLIVLCGVAFVNLAGCQGSAVYYYRDPARQVVVLDRREISVVPLGNGRWEAYGGKQGGSSAEDMDKQKTRQIEAIEKVTGCRVTSTEFPSQNNERRLLIQATVACEPPAKR